MTSIATFVKAALAFSTTLGASGPVVIEHDPVGCVVAERFPRLEARLSPTDEVAKARILFQGETVHEWYSVQMKPEGEVFAGTLPKPLKSLKAFRYYIEVTDKAVGTSRTAEFTTAVVGSSTDCRGRLVAIALGSASVLLEGPAGILALPAGFASGGVVAAGSATGAAAAGTGAAVSGGGLSTGAVVGIAAGVSGAAAVGVARTRRGSEFDGQWTGGAQAVRNEPGTLACTLGVDLSLRLSESDGAVQGSMTAVIRSVSPAGCDDVGSTVTGPVRGSARDPMVNFRWTVLEPEPMTLDFSGTRSGTSLSGTLTGADPGSSGATFNGTWRVSR